MDILLSMELSPVPNSGCTFQVIAQYLHNYFKYMKNDYRWARTSRLII